jgi:hypothetical protein
MNGNSEPAADRQELKKVYETPQLVVYGSVAELTQSGATVSANDGQTHRARRP